jgi:hypothetical protein
LNKEEGWKGVKKYKAENEYIYIKREMNMEWEKERERREYCI